MLERLSRHGGQHPDVIAAMQETIAALRRREPAGHPPTSPARTHAHVLLEEELADLHGKEAALLFTSG